MRLIRALVLPTFPVLLLTFTACATARGDLAGAAADDLTQTKAAITAHPLLAALQADVAKTQAWVEARIAAGTLDPLRAEMARLCPRVTTLALANLATKVDAYIATLRAVEAAAVTPAEPDGPDLLYRATVAEFGDQPSPDRRIDALRDHARQIAADIRFRMLAVKAGCGHLLQHRIDDLLVLVARLGIRVALP